MEQDEVIFEQRDNYLFIKIKGIRKSTAQLLEGSQRVVELAEKYKCYNILCDYTEINFELNLSEAFNLVRLYETRLANFHKVRVAGVVSPQYIELAGFWEKISKKRGFENRAFTDVAIAESWLKSIANKKINY